MCITHRRGPKMQRVIVSKATISTIPKQKPKRKEKKKSQSHLPTEIECQQRQNKEINADIPKPNNSKHSTNYVDELFQYNTTCRR